MEWTTVLEIIATISGLLCVYLQTEEKILAWPFGIISVSLLAIIFYHNRLFSDLILHGILLILNIYGWHYWSNRNSIVIEKIPIQLFQTKDWMVWPLVIIAVTPVWGYLMNHYFRAEMAYLDAFTTVGSLIAQYLLAKKYLQNWTLWIIVDIVAIGVYLYKGIYIVAFLFFAYLLLCIKGYLDWKKELQLNNTITT